MAETAPFWSESERVRNAIVDMLLAAEDGYVSGQAMSESLGITRTAVWKHLQHLMELGFAIEAVHGQGYRLRGHPDILMAPLLRRRLPSACRLGQDAVWVPRVDSTNALAWQCAREGAPHGLVVSAGEQTGGRGRHGRSWFSPQGGLWMSVLLRRPIPLSRAAEVTLLASVAVRRAIGETTGLWPGIKWPNDIVHHGRKLCGILAEIRADGEVVEQVVLGIGINANIPADAFPPELRRTATSVLAETGTSVDRVALAAALLAAFDPWLEALADDRPAFAELAEEWRAANVTLGRWVRVATPTRLLVGVAERVDDRGVLYIRTESGEVCAVHSGDVLF